MAELTEPQKHEIVAMLACFCEAKTIIAHFRSEYGLDLEHKQIGRYDPHRSYYEGGEKWRAIFNARRTKYLNDVSAVPVAHQAYRLNILQRGVEAAQVAGNWPLAADLLKQAAKEVGGIFTPQRSLQIASEQPKNPADMSPEERRAALTEIIRKVQENYCATKATNCVSA